MDLLDAYLDELVAHLDCDPLRRDEIRLEMHLHLAEMVTDREREGMDAAAAARAAVEAFGPVERVAEGLAAANHGRMPTSRPVHPAARVLGVVLAVAGFLATYLLSIGIPQAIVLPHGSGRFPDWYLPTMQFVLPVLYGLGGGLVTWVVATINRRPWEAALALIVLSVYMIMWRGEPDEKPPLAALLALPLAAAAVAYWFTGLPQWPRALGGRAVCPFLIEYGPLDAYLSDLVKHLPGDPLRRDEIRLEVHTGLRERIELLCRRGMSPYAAVKAGLRRFSAPQQAAARLTVAGQVAAGPSPPLGRRALALFLGTWTWIVLGYGLRIVGVIVRQRLGWPVQADSEVWVSYAVELSTGGLATFIAWRVSRRPWDVVVVGCVLVVLQLLLPRLPWLGLGNPRLMLLGAIPMANWLTRRRRRA